MPKFTFICEHKDFHGNDDSKITYEFEKDALWEVVEEFERFLKGSGFVFEGELEVVNDELEDDYSDCIPEINLDEANENFEIKLDDIQYDLDFGGAQPTLNVGIDSDDLNFGSATSSAVWPFPLNERPS